MTVQLEGRLAGPWVRELEHGIEAGRRSSVLRFDLTGVTFIDAAGKELLAAVHANGAEFLISGCMMRAVVAEIAGSRLIQRAIVHHVGLALGLEGCDHWRRSQ
jgi:anti-anti-sigma regulatory factor